MQKMPPAPRRKGKVGIFAVIIVVVVILASAGGIFAYSLHNKTTGSAATIPHTTATSKSATSSSSPTAGTTATTSTTATTATTPGTTPGTQSTPSATIIPNLNGLTLTCSQCASEPVHVTINSVQIDTANGRTIWDTSLKDVTQSNRGFVIEQYNLEASGSTTPVSAQIAQTHFSGNAADTQAIFAFIPSPTITYTLTITVNWGNVINSDFSYDPVQVTFPTNGTPTAVAPQPAQTVANGTITKNLTLTCSQCASEPIHVTINTIQFDNTNGRMIWDTTLKDVTQSNRGFVIEQYDLQASGSTTQVGAVLSQSQFSGNQADMQAIFAFVPSPGVTYTLTIIVNWGNVVNNDLPYDPVKITF